jgi:hypothetical protein
MIATLAASQNSYYKKPCCKGCSAQYPTGQFFFYGQFCDVAKVVIIQRKIFSNFGL